MNRITWAVPAVLTAAAFLRAACGQEALTDNRYRDWNPVLSPDGRTLVYLSSRETTDLWAADVESRAERRLTATPEREKGAAFSPNSKRLAFLILRDLTNRVQILDIPTGQARDLGPGDDIAWSPDGAEIASRDDTGVFILNAETGARRRLIPASRAGIGSVQWSRKEKALYYLHEGDLWKAATDGPPAPVKLFSGKVEDSRANFIYFALAPDEKRCLAIIDLSRLAIRNEDEAVLLGPNEEDRKRLGPMDPPIWASGGRDIIFCREGNLYRSGPGAEAKRIAGEDNACESPVVSADGAWVYFAARNPERRGPGGRILSKYAEIYRVRLDRTNAPQTQ